VIWLSAIIVVGVRSGRPEEPAAPIPSPSDLPGGPPLDQVLVLPARAVGSTQVGYNTKGPPPWPKGNCFWLSPEPRDRAAPKYHVVNMHAENFERVVRDLGIVTVEVLLVSKAHCLIVDPRIPRAWLRDAPCEICSPPAVRQRLWDGNAEWFRQP
jgi:hypothetical protein